MTCVHTLCIVDSSQQTLAPARVNDDMCLVEMNPNLYVPLHLVAPYLGSTEGMSSGSTLPRQHRESECETWLQGWTGLALKRTLDLSRLCTYIKDIHLFGYTDILLTPISYQIYPCHFLQHVIPLLHTVLPYASSIVLLYTFGLFWPYLMFLLSF